MSLMKFIVFLHSFRIRSTEFLCMIVSVTKLSLRRYEMYNKVCESVETCLISRRLNSMFTFFLSSFCSFLCNQNSPCETKSNTHILLRPYTSSVFCAIANKFCSIYSLSSLHNGAAQTKCACKKELKSCG